MSLHTYLTNTRIHLRACEPEDLEIMYQIENNPLVWDVSGVTAPYSHYVLRQYIETSKNDIYADRQLRLMIVEKKTNNTIGIADLTDFDPLHSRAGVGIVIQEEYRKLGYAQETLRILSEYAFSFLHLHQLSAIIPYDNKDSLKLFVNSGFIRSAVLKEWLQTDNGFKDAYLLQRING